MDLGFKIIADHYEFPWVFIVTILIMMSSFSINMHVITSSLGFNQKFQQ